MTSSKNTQSLQSTTSLFSWLAGLLLAGSCSQLSYALHPRKGPFIGYVEIVAAAVVLVWGIHALVARRLRGLAWPPWPIWALLAVAVLSVGKATSVKSAGVEIAQYLLYFIALYAFLAEALRQREAVLVAGASMGLAVSAVVALAQMFTGTDAMQISGLAANRNVYSAICAILLPLPWAWACRQWPSVRSWLAAAACSIVLLTMLGPPHVWIALLVLVWLAAAMLKNQWHKLAGPVVAAVIAVNFLSPLHRSCNVDELLNPWETGNVYKLLREAGAQEDIKLVKKRWLEWWPAVAMIADQPVLGVGVGNYQLNIGLPAYWGYVPNAKKTEPDTNNLYLVTGGSMGLAGLAALLAVFAYFYARARRAWQEDEAWVWAGIAGALAALVCVNFFTATLVRGAAIAWAGLFAATHFHWARSKVVK